MSKLTKMLACAVALAAMLGPGHALAGGDKVVVELFTSQGCSSCPPADRLLGELAARDDVIALSFHVDYWNYLGWKDPFSSAEATRRQNSYRAAFGLRHIYTPQMVIGGSRETVGSHRDKVLRAIEEARADKRISIDVARPDAETAILTLGEGTPSNGPATVWLFAFDKRHTTEIRRGENEGVKLANSHVVRAARRVGKWTGGPGTIKLPLAMMGIDGQDGCAIVVQSDGGGRVYGATMFPLKQSGL